MQVSRRLLLGGAAALSTVAASARPRSGKAQDQARRADRSVGYLSRQHRPRLRSPARARRSTEFNPSAHGFDVELISADHQNKPDVAATIARQWCDQGVDALIDVPTSSVALAVAQVAKEKDKIMLNASATTTDLT